MGSNLQLVDIHNHTIWSDGANTLIEIVENGVEHALSVVGICDHFEDNTANTVSQMNISHYIDAVNQLKKKYSNEIRIINGLEIPLHLLLNDYMKMHSDIFNGLDFILIEDFEFIKGIEFFKDVKKNLDMLNCIKGLAHCDLLRLRTYGFSLAYIAKMIKELDCFWEINSATRHGFFDDIVYYGQQKSKEIDELFIELNRNDIKVTAGSDCHCIDGYEYGRLLQANKTMNEFLVPYIFQTTEFN